MPNTLAPMLCDLFFFRKSLAVKTSDGLPGPSCSLVSQYLLKIPFLDRFKHTLDLNDDDDDDDDDDDGHYSFRRSC